MQYVHYRHKHAQYWQPHLAVHESLSAYSVRSHPCPLSILYKEALANCVAQPCLHNHTHAPNRFGYSPTHPHPNTSHLLQALPQPNHRMLYSAHDCYAPTIRGFPYEQTILYPRHFAAQHRLHKHPLNVPTPPASLQTSLYLLIIPATTSKE